MHALRDRANHTFLEGKSRRKSSKRAILILGGHFSSPIRKVSVLLGIDLKIATVCTTRAAYR